MKELPHTLERLVPEQIGLSEITGARSLQLHLERYEFAASRSRPGRLLDLACGAGFGTRLLTDRCDGVTEALGVDISSEAIAYARERYGNERTHFIADDAMSFKDAKGFDTIISLETIEHLQDPRSFVARLTRLLRPNGVLVASAPITPTVDVDPYHLHDFTKRSFHDLFRGNELAEIDSQLQVQRIDIVSLLRRKEARMADVRRNLPLYYLARPGALMRRLWSTAFNGLTVKYLTVAWRAV